MLTQTLLVLWAERWPVAVAVVVAALVAVVVADVRRRLRGPVPVQIEEASGW